MARKKFFYNRVYNVRRNIRNAIIIAVCLIGIIVCFIITSNMKTPSGKEGTLNIKNEVIAEVNTAISKEMFFSKIENADLKNVKITYPSNFNNDVLGNYEVTISINNENYTSTLSIVDTEKPELVLKDVNIKVNTTYSVNDFVTSCTDNSGKDCIISFYELAIDENNQKIDYASYKEEGKYPIKVSAKDSSGNETVKEATLEITKNGFNTPKEDEEITCKYGYNDYDKNEYLITFYVSSNKCAVSLDNFTNEKVIAKVEEIYALEIRKLKKEINALNLEGTIEFLRRPTGIINSTGNGFVGYQLAVYVDIKNNSQSKRIVSYRINTDGKRVFIDNPYNFST